MIQKQKHNINKIANEIESEFGLEIYWDYKDELSEEQILKIILEEDGLMEVEDELYEHNIDYISETVTEAIKEYCKKHDIELDDEELDELRMECESRFKFDINGLLNNSSAHIRVQLNTNEGMIDTNEGMKNETVRMFRKRFRNKFRLTDLQKEINNCSGYGNFNFYFKVSGSDILVLKEQVQQGYILLRKGLFFGLFDSFNGGGSILEMELLKDINLNLKDWRIKDDKEAVVKRLLNDTSIYYGVSIIGDSKKYGIQQVYGLISSAWKEW